MNKLIETLPSSSFAYILVVKIKGKHDYKHIAKWWLRSCTGGQNMGVALFLDWVSETDSLGGWIMEEPRDVWRKSIPGQWFSPLTLGNKFLIMFSYIFHHQNVSKAFSGQSFDQMVHLYISYAWITDGQVNGATKYLLNAKFWKYVSAKYAEVFISKWD